MWGTAGLEVAMPSSAEKSEEDGKNTVLSSVAVAQNLMFFPLRIFLVDPW